MSKTVKQLDEELQELKAVTSNVQLSAGTCWNHAQMGAILEKYARHGEMVKAEVTVEHTPSNNAYRYQIWHYPLLNPESRKNDEVVIAGMSGHDFTPIRTDATVITAASPDLSQHGLDKNANSSPSKDIQ